jgi:hypothetical protein
VSKYSRARINGTLYELSQISGMAIATQGRPEAQRCSLGKDLIDVIAGNHACSENAGQIKYLWYATHAFVNIIVRANASRLPVYSRFPNGLVER